MRMFEESYSLAASLIGRGTGRAALVAALVVTLAGCTTGAGGGSTSALVGGFAPSEPAQTPRAIAAAMGGGLLGGSASQLGDRDRQLALEAEYRALEYGRSGEAIAWQGDNSATSGQVTALQPYRVGSQDCRQYSHTVRVDGQTQTVQGAACRNADGSWTPLV